MSGLLWVLVFTMTVNGAMSSLEAPFKSYLKCEDAMSNTVTRLDMESFPELDISVDLRCLKVVR